MWRIEGRDLLFDAAYGFLTRLEKNWIVCFCEGRHHVLVLVQLGSKKSSLGLDTLISWFAILRPVLRGQRWEPGVLGSAGEG